MTAETLSREDLLALTPQVYLRQGFRDHGGAPRKELLGLWALAAAEQLKDAGLVPGDLDPAVAAVAKVALEHARAPREKLDAEALLTALDTARPSAPVRSLLKGCVGALRDRQDLRPMVEHLGAALRTLALLCAAPPPERSRR